MELGEEERYATAALFTLALHSSQVDAGAGRQDFRDPVPRGWGEPSPQVLDRFLEGRGAHPELDGPAWDAFWGWDCCGPDGLLDRVYQQLELPERTWGGLKKLPEVAYGDGFEEFMDLVRTYMAVLDTSFPTPKRRKKRKKRSLLSPVHQSIDTMLFGQQAGGSAPSTLGASSRRSTGGDNFKFSGGGGHLIIRGKSENAGEAFQPAQPVHRELAGDDEDAPQEREVRDDLFADALMSDSGNDSDLEGDLRRANLAKQFELPHASSAASLGDALSDSGGGNSRPITPAGSGLGLSAAGGTGAEVAVSLYVKPMDDALGGHTELVTLNLKVHDGLPGPDGLLASGCWSPTSSVCTDLSDVKSLKAPTAAAAVGPREPSKKALAAMWELLEGCLALVHPELLEELQERKLQELEQRLEKAAQRQQQQQQQGGTGGSEEVPAEAAASAAAASATDVPSDTPGGAPPPPQVPSGQHPVPQPEAPGAAAVGGSPALSPPVLQQKQGTPLANGRMASPRDLISLDSDVENQAAQQQQQQDNSPSFSSPFGNNTTDPLGNAADAAAAPAAGWLRPHADGEEVMGDGLLVDIPLRSDEQSGAEPSPGLVDVPLHLDEQPGAEPGPSSFSTEAAAASAPAGGEADGGSSSAGHGDQAEPSTHPAKKQGAAAKEEDEVVAPLMPKVRWYDARARTAVKRLAHWLNVPWSRVVNFEMLLAYQLQTGERKRPEVHVDNWAQSKRWAKVGSIALAGGAAFAVVGGLVMAPALVFALPVLSLTAAGTFMTTTGGVAMVSTTMGALGMVDAGARAKRRTQYDIKEFGFMEVRYTPREPPPKQQDSSKDGGGSTKEGSSKGAEDDGGSAAAGGEGSSSGKGGGAAASSAAVREDEPQQHFLRPDSASSLSSARSGGLPGSGASTGLSGGSLLGRMTEDSGTAAAAAADAGHLDPGHLTLGLANGGSAHPVRPRGLANGAAAGGPRRMVSNDTERLLDGQQSSSPDPAQPPPLGMRRWFTFGGYSNVSSRSDADAAGGASSSGGGGASSSGGGGCEGGGEQEDLKELTPREQRKADKAAAKAEKAAEQEWWQNMKESELLSFPLKKSRSAANRSAAGDISDSNMSVVIAVNGWIGNRTDFLSQWSTLRAPDADVFTLVWESKELIALNNALTNFFLTQVAQQCAQSALSKLFLGPLVAAVVPAIALNTASAVLIDNAWAVTVERSIKAGKLLAHTLMTGGHGDRPVVLVGYSMGARLVFHCLLELCRHNCKGLVEHAVMLGMPVSVRPERWRMARSVVAGRFINGYSRNDWVLQVVYRTSKGFTQAAGGLCPVNLPGVENVNLTGLIDGHFSYMKHIDEVMDLINLWPRDSG